MCRKPHCYLCNLTCRLSICPTYCTTERPQAAVRGELKHEERSAVVYRFKPEPILLSQMQHIFLSRLVIAEVLNGANHLLKMNLIYLFVNVKEILCRLLLFRDMFVSR